MAGRILRCGPIALDDAARTVTVAARRVDLSPREFAMLECFLRHQGQVLTRDQLLDHAWPHGVEVLPGSVDAYVYFLRRKLGADGGRLIETVRGTGYRMVRG
jgi:DNA-binding response OmpR family regulator